MSRVVAGVLLALLSQTPALAQNAAPPPPPKVILLRPPTTPSAVNEALARLRGELTLEGFDAEVVDAVLGDDVRVSLEKLAPTMKATALVAVVPGVEAASAELWVVDRMTGKTLVRHVRADPKAAARIPEVLSVRAVELLRASFLELAITSRPGAKPPEEPPPVPIAPVVTRWATEPFEDPDWVWAVEAGGGALDGASFLPDRVGSEFVPIARLQRAFGEGFCARVTFAGLGTEARVNTPGGYADVSQSVVLAEAVVRFRRGRRFEPILSLAAGTLRFSAQGHQSAPYDSASGTRWVFAGGAGFGFRIPIRPRRFEVGVEIQALLAQPSPVVRFFDTELARAGRPTLFASVTLLGGF